MPVLFPFAGPTLPSSLYMLGSGHDALYRLDATTGVATIPGSVADFGTNEIGPSGLAYHNGTLYMVGSSHDGLFRLNPTTGIAEQGTNRTTRTNRT